MFFNPLVDLRLTLDCNVTLVDETKRSDALVKFWCLSNDEAKNAAKAIIVPYNVFEVKLAGDNPIPQVLAEFISGAVIEEAPKFSKFLMGATAFNRVPTLPYWANHPSFTAMFGLARSQESEDTYQYSSLLDPCNCHHLFSGNTTSGNGVPKRETQLHSFWTHPLGLHPSKKLTSPKRSLSELSPNFLPMSVRSSSGSVLLCSFSHLLPS